jgi:cytochrome c-type protein NapB
MFFNFQNGFNGGNDMKRTTFFLFSFFYVVMIGATASAADTYKSLRGDTDIPAKSTAPVAMDWKPAKSTIARTFDLQPPLIPHDIADYDVNTSENACLECHADPDSDATKLSKTHFMDRDGKTHDKVSSLRYFCLQCHVGQVDAKPLVENTFQTK